MDKTATQSIQLIENEMVISFINPVIPESGTGASYISEKGIKVSQYKTTSDGVYFIHDLSFIVQNKLLNKDNERKLFFVPYVHIAGMEIKLKPEAPVTDENRPSGEATGTVVKSEPAMG